MPVESLLPANATALERDLEASMAALAAMDVPIRHLWNPDRCPIEALPWLAWALSVERWDPGWPEDVKRRVVRTSIMEHRMKGTLGAVRCALDDLGAVYKLTENPRGHHTLDVDILNSGTLIGEYVTAAHVREKIDAAKRLSVHYNLNLTAGVEIDLPLGVAVAAPVQVADFACVVEDPA